MLRAWLLATRPKTLPAALAPVLVGTALAATAGSWRLDLALGSASATAWGCDLSRDYVRINASYRT